LEGRKDHSREVLLHTEGLMMDIVVVGVVGEEELKSNRIEEREKGFSSKLTSFFPSFLLLQNRN